MNAPETPTVPPREKVAKALAWFREDPEKRIRWITFPPMGLPGNPQEHATVLVRAALAGAVPDTGQAREPDLRCDLCGRSTADSDREMAAPVVYFVRQGLCHPCSRSTAAPDAGPSGDTGQASEIPTGQAFLDAFYTPSLLSRDTGEADRG